MKYRVELLKKCALDKDFQAATKELFFSDILFAFNAFYYTLDVRKRPLHKQPFCTYEFQDERLLKIVDSIKKGEDLISEKSRDMGWSWMVLGVYIWFWLNPEGGADFLLGSRIEDYVDKKGDMRTLMEKNRYLLNNLPKWILPKGFNKKRDDNFMRLTNPETGSSITGESNNKNFSTGGRYASILFDELSKWQDTDEQAWMSAGDATPCRIALGTPFGAFGQYYNLVTDPTKDKLVTHWSLHPEKGAGLYCVWPKPKNAPKIVDQYHWQSKALRSPWYDKQVERRSQREIAQELDIDYIGAGNPVFAERAGERLATLIRTTDFEAEWYDINISTSRLNSIPKPRNIEGFLAVYQKPVKNGNYTIGVDVAEGREEGDFSVVKVFDRETKSIAASYASRIDEVQLAYIVKAVADFYPRHWVGIETNGPGMSTFNDVFKLEVTNLFMMPKYDAVGGTMTYNKGWRTTSMSRPMLVSGIKEWLIEEAGWCDARCTREMITFVHDKVGKPVAKGGCHDDEVIALGICIQVDILSPLEHVKKPVKRRHDGLPEKMFILDQLKMDEEPLTIQDRCLASIAEKQAELKELYSEFYEYNL